MDTEALNIEGRVGNGACDLLGDRSSAYGCSQSCSSTRHSARGPRISATGLFRVSRDPERAGSRAEFKLAKLQPILSEDLSTLRARVTTWSWRLQIPELCAETSSHRNAELASRKLPGFASSQDSAPLSS